MVPFLDLKAQYRSIEPQVKKAVESVLNDCSYILGPEVAAFEKEFAEYCHTEHCSAVNSGTSALHLALSAAGIGAGDEVITVPFTFVATVAAIVYTGARPVFVDVETDTLTMDPALIEAAITPNTKAILPVHIHGQPADMDPIMDVAEKHRLIVIEDAAQAHGAEYKGRRAGNIGQLGCFSFYPGKNLGAYGEGGAVVTNSPEYDQKIKMLRDWGQTQKYHHDLLGFNYRMDGIQGAILRIKLQQLEGWTKHRRSNANLYNACLASTDVKTPIAKNHNRHVYHVYSIRTQKRAKLQDALTEKSIQTGIHYPIPVHLQPAYSFLGHKKGDFPITEKAAEEVLSLPMFPELTQKQIEAVCLVLREVAGEKK